MDTIVYIDALNFYYSAVRNSPYRWLDFRALCQTLLPTHRVTKIKYFTSHVRGYPDNPTAPIRQQMFLRALQTLPDFEIILGSRAHEKKWLRLASDHTQSVRVIQDTEKGSDVNLAVHLVRDGFKKFYEIATVVSNDSDLEEAFRIVHQELGYNIVLICPSRNANSKLVPLASSVIPVRKHVLKACQLPDVLHDAKGEVRKPIEWK